MPRYSLIALLVTAPLLWSQTGCAGIAHVQDKYEVIHDKEYVLRASGPLRSDIYVPKGPGPFPAVIVIHGGGWEGGERSDMDRFARELAANGFVAMNISYRLAPDAIHPAQLEDCQAAVQWLRDHAASYKVASDQIGAFGYSAGAHLAMLMAVKPVKTGEDNSVRAVVAGAGPTDLRKYPDSDLVQGYMGGPPEGREDRYADASPIVHVSRNDAPIYIYHGKRDRLVGIDQAEAMASALNSAGVAHELDVQPFGHVLTYFLDEEVMQRAVAFLRENLVNNSYN